MKESWSHNLSDGGTEQLVPVTDNMYFTNDQSNLAIVTQDFSGKGSLNVHSGLDTQPLVIQNDGKTWRTSGAIRINDERSWRRGVVVFQGGSFFASSMVVGSVITNSCSATLEDTVMTLSGATTLNQGILALGAGATLATTCVAYGTSTKAAHLVFNGGTLRYSPASLAEVFVPASGDFFVTVGSAGGTIDTAGGDLTVEASIADASGEAGNMAFAGGGKVLLTGAVEWTGGTTIAAGTCLAVTNGVMKDALLANGVTLSVPDAWLEDWSAAPADVSLMRIDSAYGRFKPSDLDRFSMSSGVAAAKTLRLSADFKEVLLRRPVVYSGTMSGSGESNLGGLSWNRALPSRFSARDIVWVKCTASATLNLDRSMGVSGVVFDVAPGAALSVKGADKLSAARLRLTGGGTLRFLTAPGTLGAASVEVGSCIEVPDQKTGDGLLGGGLTLINPRALIDRNGAVSVVRHIGDGVFDNAAASKVAFPGGLRPSARRSADGKAIELVVVRHTATLNGGTPELDSLSWSPSLTAVQGSDVLVVNVKKDTTLNIGASIHPFAVKFVVSSGKKLTLTGCDVTAPFVWQEGGTVVVSNVQSCPDAKIVRIGRLLGGGTFAADSGSARCEIEDVSGFAGTLDSGGGLASTWRVILKGGVSLKPASGGEVALLGGGSATVAADAQPLASGEGATVKGTLRIARGAELFARASGTASGGRYVLDEGAHLRVRFTNAGVSPTVNNLAD